MTHKSFCSTSALLTTPLLKTSLPAALTGILLLFSWMWPAAPASAAAGCSKAWSVELPAAERGVTEEGVATFRVDAPPFHWLVVEAQRVELTAGHTADRPRVQLLDATCRELRPHPTLPRLTGRAVHFVRQSGPIYVRLETDEPRASFLLDAWIGSGRNELSFNPWSKTDDPDPVPQEPVDEWDELWTGVAKNDDPDPVPQEPVDEWDELVDDAECRIALTKNDDPDPVPQEPVDEWDELRTDGQDRCRIHSRSQAREIPGLGILAEARGGLELRSLCSRAGHPALLGTLTCARSLRFDASGQADVTSILSDRPEILAIDLDRDFKLSVVGAGHTTVLDAEGRRIHTEGEAGWALPAGRYYLEARQGGTQFTVSVHSESDHH